MWVERELVVNGERLKKRLGNMSTNCNFHNGYLSNMNPRRGEILDRISGHFDFRNSTDTESLNSQVTPSLEIRTALEADIWRCALVWRCSSSARMLACASSSKPGSSACVNGSHSSNSMSSLADDSDISARFCDAIGLLYGGAESRSGSECCTSIHGVLIIMARKVEGRGGKGQCQEISTVTTKDGGGGKLVSEKIGNLLNYLNFCGAMQHVRSSCNIRCQWALDFDRTSNHRRCYCHPFATCCVLQEW